MSDVRFRNLDNVPLQEEFSTSTVFKISAASKFAAVAIGIVALCVFTLTDNAKSAITTISNVDGGNGQCKMLSSFSGALPRPGTEVTEDVAKGFIDGYDALMKDVTGLPALYPIDSMARTTDRISLFLRDRNDAVTLFQVYFPTYQSCIDAFSKPPVCSYVQNNREGDIDKPAMTMNVQLLRSVRVESACQSSMKCTWPEIMLQDGWDLWKVYINATTFKCAPSANLTTCETISSKCPEYASIAAGFSKLFHQIHPAQQMCQTFKSNPPYSCESFQVVSPIQVISQTLSLMATALGGCELFLFALLKYRRIFTRSTPIAPDKPKADE
jgi:hypothetical protein